MSIMSEPLPSSTYYMNVEYPAPKQKPLPKNLQPKPRRKRRSVAPAQPSGDEGRMPIKAPGNDQLSKLWNAIVENTKGDGFWIGEILLTTLEREVGFNPAALKDAGL